MIKKSSKRMPALISITAIYILISIHEQTFISFDWGVAGKALLSGAVGYFISDVCNSN